MFFHHIGIETNNMKKSLGFYQDLLGFSVSKEFTWNNERIIFLEKDDSLLEIVETNGEIVHNPHIHIAFKVPSITKIIEMLAQHHINPNEGPFRIHDLETVFFTGPNQEMIEFVSENIPS